MNTATDQTAAPPLAAPPTLDGWIKRLFAEFDAPLVGAVAAPYRQALRDVPVDFLDAVLKRIHRQRPHEPGDGPPAADFFGQLWDHRQARLAGNVPLSEQITPGRLRALRQQLRSETALALSGVARPPLKYRTIPVFMRGIIGETVAEFDRAFPAGIPAGFKGDERVEIVEHYIQRARNRLDELASQQFELTPTEATHG